MHDILLIEMWPELAGEEIPDEYLQMLRNSRLRFTRAFEAVAGQLERIQQMPDEKSVIEEVSAHAGSGGMILVGAVALLTGIGKWLGLHVERRANAKEQLEKERLAVERDKIEAQRKNTEQLIELTAAVITSRDLNRQMLDILMSQSRFVESSPKHNHKPKD